MYLTWNTLFILLKAFHHWNEAFRLLGQSLAEKHELFDLVASLETISVAGRGSCCLFLRGVVRTRSWSLLSKWQAITYARPLAFCKPKSVCFFFLYKREKEGKWELGGRRLTHPALENQEGLWNVIYAPLAQLCTDPNLRNKTGPY